LLFGAGIGLMYWVYHFTVEAESVLPLRVALLIPRENQAEKAPDGTFPVVIRFLGSHDSMFGAVAGELLTQRPKGHQLADIPLLGQQDAVIFLPDFDKILGPEMLASGRLPAAGTNEVLAGQEVEQKDRVTVEGQTLQVVGILPRTGRPLSHTYIVRGPQRPQGLFQPGDAVKNGFILVQPRGEKPASSTISRDHWTILESSLRLMRHDFNAYLTGMVLMFAGGSALCVAGYFPLARRVTNRWLGPPLAVIANRAKLLIWLHVAFFGLMLASALSIYDFPVVQGSLLAG